MIDKFEQSIERPLVIASSGGGGHIAAAKGYIDDLKNRKNVEIINHTATRYDARQSNPIRTLFKAILYVKSFEYVSDTWEWFHEQTGVSNVLEYHSFWQEISYLKDPTRNPAERPYVDLLLDLYSFGYEMVAIFNALQRHDKIEKLLSTVKKQAANDQLHYVFIKARLIERLKKQAETGKPYTSIVSTQPQSLGAMCDAVEWYNNIYLPEQYKKLTKLNERINILHQSISNIDQTLQNGATTYFQSLQLLWLQWVTLFFAQRELHALEKQKAGIGDELVPLHIHQYMTDLPTSGAIHFSQSLERLSESQRAYIDVYCLNEPNPELRSLKNLKIHALSPEENPMLRAAFRDKKALLPYASHDLMTLPYSDGENNCERQIPADAKVASIMLGSLGGDASAAYILPLLKKGYTHIFVFGAKGNETIANMIASLPESQRHSIIALGNQSDKTIAPIMTRSDCVITRSGGLSTMEQMALPIIENKLVLIHHSNPDTDEEELTSGLPWEDGNADVLIDHFKAAGVHAQKTCPNRIHSALSLPIEPRTLLPHLSMFNSDKIKKDDSLDVENHDESLSNPSCLSWFSTTCFGS